MYELHQVGSRTYYMEAPAKVGVYLLPDNGVLLIDSGSDKDAAKKSSGNVRKRGGPFLRSWLPILMPTISVETSIFRARRGVRYMPARLKPPSADSQFWYR